MMRFKRKGFHLLTLVIVVLLIYPGSLAAKKKGAHLVVEIQDDQSKQSTANGKFYWVNLGLGGSSVDADNGAALALSVNVTYQFGRNMLSLRAVGCGKLFGKTMNEYGLLYGRVLASSPFFVSFGAGAAVVSGSISHGLFSTKELEKIGPTIGLPLEVQLFWRPFRVVGVGLYGFANLNFEESYVGVTICLQFGKLRK